MTRAPGKFTVGDRVERAPGHRGTVVRVAGPSLRAQHQAGITVQWDSGHRGRVACPTNTLRKVPS